ncbi:MAG: D-glycero-beta-D-manno-heptose-7-phosphate kinase [Candidatus Paracaedibacteraceae bacterium]|nr:D-glycero-beta-D-manno-heptose-7-phosphate kinase [Candidatus Paracaedibacteraceae bacterium]
MPLSFLDFDHLEQASKKRILCVGDCMLDKFVYGHVGRISPEAPIPVFQESRETKMLGGAANVAANISAYGGNVDFISIIGDDEEGEIILKLLGYQSSITSHLIREQLRPTTTKTRYVSHSQHLLRVDKETCVEPLRETQSALQLAFNELIKQSDIVLLSDYKKGLFSASLTQQLIQTARSYNKTVIIDPKGTDYQKYVGASILTPNRSELKAATGLPVTTDAEVEAAARHLIQAYGIETILVTRSEEGMSLITATQVCHIETQAQEVYDVSGAGDTAIATLALALACGIETSHACEIANAAAGIAVSKSGTVVVYLDELKRVLLRKYCSHYPEKLTTLMSAQKLVLSWKAAGKKIGFTNGCFDLLHPGHVTLLKKAKQLCDILIVGLNSDNSVKQLKGEQRPLQQEEARAAVLSAIGDTDLIVIFDELTPLNLIQTLQPDVLIKGSDYTIDQVVGADMVQAKGGRVVLVDLVPNFSTTRIVKKLSA